MIRLAATVALAGLAGAGSWFTTGALVDLPTASPAPCQLRQINAAWSGSEPSGDGGQVKGLDWICNDGTWTGPFAPVAS